MSKAHGVTLTTALLPEAAAFLDAVAPPRTKGKYLSALLMREQGRREALAELAARVQTMAEREEWDTDGGCVD